MIATPNQPVIFVRYRRKLCWDELVKNFSSSTPDAITGPSKLAAVRLAWFSPMPPRRSGIAAYSAEILPLLRPCYDTIDIFVDRLGDAPAAGEFSAHDFVWKHRRNPYDLTVFQLGNASCHDYMWAYLFHYPGLVVLHDAQLHQARALALLKRRDPRRDDYVAEFEANHPEAPADAAELVMAGLAEGLYQYWPFIRLVLESARLVVVHNDQVAVDLSERYPRAQIAAIPMGVGDPNATESRDAILARHGIPRDALVVGAFGGITPEKRITQLLEAVGVLASQYSNLHVMLVGEEVPHFNAASAAERSRIADRVHITGYVPDVSLPSYMAAADICSCLRWPTNRETSASWLRCLAAGRPTVVTDVAHLQPVPTLRFPAFASQGNEAIAVSIDLVDEQRALPAALDWLLSDGGHRQQLGKAARAWWETHHTLVHMLDGYRDVVARAVAREPGAVSLPLHLTNYGSDLLRALAEASGVGSRVSDLLSSVGQQRGARSG
jgi:glycosyltransferase involved in cell wall biosynthesis